METLRKLNKSFINGNILTGEELNELIYYINNTVDFINEQIKTAIENNAGRDGNNGTNGSDGAQGIEGISTLTAFVGAIDTTDAVNKLGNRNQTVYPPGQYSISSNVSLLSNEALFMTSARRRGESGWITTDGYYWSTPVQIGTSNTTSTTGVDTDNKNYIYCRTKKDVDASLHYPDTNYNRTLLMSRIESHPGHGYKYGSGNFQEVLDLDNSSINTLNGTWTDHPYGISENLPHEWMVGYSKNEQDEWEYSFGPIMISNYGFDGLDGDGLEYIFKVVDSNTVPTLTPPYSGNVGETYYNNVLVNSETYLQDDFIPTGWYDEPLNVSLLYPKQYVSIRKRTGLLEGDNEWGAFSTPKLWGTYSTSGYNLILDNDNILLQENINSNTIKSLSLTKLHLWNGNSDIISSNLYDIILNVSATNGLNTELGIATISSISGSTITLRNENIWGTNINVYNSLSSNNFFGICLYKLNNDDLVSRIASILYTIKIYPLNEYNPLVTPLFELTKILGILIASLAEVENATLYQLEIDNNLLHYSVDYAGNYTWTPNLINLILKRTVGSITTTLNLIPAGMSLYRISYDSSHNLVNSTAATPGNISPSSIAIGSNIIYPEIKFALYDSSDNTGNIISQVLITTKRDYLRMLVSAGTWKDSVEYVMTDYTVPLVYHLGYYWYLINSTNKINNTNVAPANSSGNPWAKASEYEVILTKALFADFAKLGSFVVYGKYFFSLFGYKIGNNNGVETKELINSLSTAPGVWQYFDPNDPMASTLPSSGNYKFRPMKCINAESGEEWGAGGNIHMGADGSLSVKGDIVANSFVGGSNYSMTLLANNFKLVDSNNNTVFGKLDPLDNTISFSGDIKTGEYTLGNDTYYKNEITLNNGGLLADGIILWDNSGEVYIGPDSSNGIHIYKDVLDNTHIALMGTIETDETHFRGSGGNIELYGSDAQGNNSSGVDILIRCNEGLTVRPHHTTDPGGAIAGQQSASEGTEVIMSGENVVFNNDDYGGVYIGKGTPNLGTNRGNNWTGYDDFCGTKYPVGVFVKGGNGKIYRGYTGIVLITSGVSLVFINGIMIGTADQIGNTELTNLGF